LVFAIFLVSQGMIDNFKGYDAAALTEKETVQVPKNDANGNPVKDAQGNPVMVPQVVDTQSIPEGPMASQMAIKMLGTNGGGYTNANAAHPFENPTPFSNFIQMLSIFAIPSALTYYLGRMVKSPGHGWSVWAAMCILFLAGFFVAWHYEAAGNPILTQLGVDPADGNMEGKEVRFGITNSALFATITTDASCGAVNSMHDSFTPLGGLVPLFNIELGEVVFGGTGAGLYGMLVFVIVAVFIAGLMVGRTPEYLGKKIESYDVQMAMLYLLIFPLIILGFAAVTVLMPNLGLSMLGNHGPHGFSEVLYAYASATGNNGSAFGGITTNTHWYNYSLGVAMFFGRFMMIIPMLAIAGNLAGKKIVPETAGTFPVTTPLFTILLTSVIVIVGALTFFPALSLGPVLEHLLLHAGKTF
jgi:K+-transporting ATPase ATPase A chain